MEGHEGGHGEGQMVFPEEGQRDLLRKDVMGVVGTVGRYFMSCNEGIREKKASWKRS